MRVSKQKRLELDKRDELILNLHKSGYSYSEILETISSNWKITPARVGQIINGAYAKANA